MNKRSAPNEPLMISEATRRDIFDAMRLDKVVWSGRLSESVFLARLFDLNAMPSDDTRYTNAARDIFQHRENNLDWDDDWVFDDPRFNLLHGPDETFLRFLCETVHPTVRPDEAEAAKLVQYFNEPLRADGFELVERTRMAGRPVYVGRHVGTATVPGMTHARATLAVADPGYVAQQITRMEAAVTNDPGLAIGTAKELVETCCKTILRECGVDFPKAAEIPQLVKLAVSTLALTPDDIPEKARGRDSIKLLLSNLATIVKALAELRNLYGTGHGQGAGAKGLGPRHAKLAVGAASTLAVFLVETHQERLATQGRPGGR